MTWWVNLSPARESCTHWREARHQVLRHPFVWKTCRITYLSHACTISLAPRPWALVPRKEPILNCGIKLVVQKSGVSLVGVCWLANRGLSLKSRRRINCALPWCELRVWLGVVYQEPSPGVIFVRRVLFSRRSGCCCLLAIRQLIPWDSVGVRGEGTTVWQHLLILSYMYTSTFLSAI